jgi:hypothetical protein
MEFEKPVVGGLKAERPNGDGMGRNGRWTFVRRDQEGHRTCLALAFVP